MQPAKVLLQTVKVLAQPVKSGFADAQSTNAVRNSADAVGNSGLAVAQSVTGIACSLKTIYNTFGEKVTQVADADTGGIKQTTEWGYDRAGRQVTITGFTDETDTEDEQTIKCYQFFKKSNTYLHISKKGLSTRINNVKPLCFEVFEGSTGLKRFIFRLL